MKKRHNEVGFNWMFWPVPPAILEVRRGNSYSVDFSENYFRPLASASKEAVPCTDEGRESLRKKMEIFFAFMHYF